MGEGSPWTWLLGWLWDSPEGGGGGEGQAGLLLTCPLLQARLWLQACHFLDLNEGSCKCLPRTAPRPPPPCTEWLKQR